MLASDWADYNSRRFPNEPALEDIETGETLSWVEVEHRVGQYARILSEHYGISCGARVVLLAENDIRMFLLELALMRLRATLVPLNWRLSIAELQAQIDQTKPVLIVHDHLWSEMAHLLAGHVIKTVSWRDSDSGESLDFMADAVNPLKSRGDEQLEDVVLVLFTSGTTGKAKGAQFTRSNLAWQTQNIAETDLIIGRGDKVFNVLPLCHAGGLNALANPVLFAGGCVGVLKRFDPSRSFELLTNSERGYTHTVVVPIMLNQIADLPTFASVPWAALKHIQLGAGSVTPSVMEAYAAKGVPIQPHYGGTELGPGVSGVPREMVATKGKSCGLPFRHTRVRLVEDGQDVAVAKVGEIWLSGPTISIGYLNAEASGSAYVGEWFKTGDLGRFDEDGYLYVVGRLKEMYKSGGESVFPAEVEAVLNEHPVIREVVVFGIPDKKWGETGVAFYATRSGSPLSREEIVEYCQGRLARYKIPTVLRWVSDLPRNVTGKVVKHELRTSFMSEFILPP